MQNISVDRNNEVLLEVRGVCKDFPGVRALDNVSLALKKGSVLALMGENGAGKSTLMKCLFGIYQKDAGSILLEGKEISFRTPREALEHGVAMVHQELNQALRRSVADNMWLGRYPTRLGVFVREGEMMAKTRTVLAELGISIDPARIMSSMSVTKAMRRFISSSERKSASIMRCMV